MGILVSTGFNQDDCTALDAQLELLGVQKASSSDKNDLTPKRLLARINGIANSSDAADSFQQDPGKVWEYAFSEIFLSGPTDRIWGWADPSNIRYLEFWQSLMPSLQTLLTYSSPASAIASVVAEGNASQDNVKQAVKLWIDFHEEVLRFYHRNHNSTLLCHLSHVTDGSDAFRKLLVERLNLAADCPPLSRYPLNEYDSLLNDICRDAVAEHAGAELIYAELENSADLCDPCSRSSLASLNSTASIIGSLRADSEDRIRQAQLLSEKVTKLSEMNSAIQTQLEDREQHNNLVLAKLHSTLLKLERQSENHANELDRQFENHANELKLQSKNHAAELDELRAARQVQGTIVDFRNDLVGSNWFEADKDGRWAGPGMVSTIDLPLGLNGPHVLHIKVVAGTSKAMLKKTQLEYDGVTIPLILQVRSEDFGRKAELLRTLFNVNGRVDPYPAKLVAKIHLSTDKIQRLTFRFPKIHDPNQGIQDRALKMRAIQFEPIV